MPTATMAIVDIIDASDYDFLMPRQWKRRIATALMVGVACVPPVQRWWIDQIEEHADHVTREFIARFVTDVPGKNAPPLAPSR